MSVGVTTGLGVVAGVPDGGSADAGHEEWMRAST
jgi:hypothetical protein